MTGIEPQVAPTRRYKTNEVCKMLEIHRNTLHRKTMEGAIKCGYRQEGSRLYPFYLGKDILRYWRNVL